MAEQILTQTQLDQILKYVVSNTSKRLPEYENVVNYVGDPRPKNYTLVYTASSGTPSLGSAVTYAKYTLWGKRCDFEFSIKFAADTTFGSAGALLQVDAPITKLSGIHVSTFKGQLFDASTTAVYEITGRLDPGSKTIQLNRSNSGGANVEFNNATGASPLSIAVNDVLSMNGSYIIDY